MTDCRNDLRLPQSYGGRPDGKPYARVRSDPRDESPIQPTVGCARHEWAAFASSLFRRREKHHRVAISVHDVIRARHDGGLPEHGEIEGTLPGLSAIVGIEEPGVPFLPLRHA